jgi:hypothetical protein
MRGFWKIPLLALGTVFGYGLAFHGMHHHHCDRDAWERHFSDVAARAGRHAKGDSVKTDNAKGETAAPKPESPEP